MLDTRLTPEHNKVFTIEHVGYNATPKITEWHRIGNFPSWTVANDIPSTIIEYELVNKYAGRIFDNEENAKAWIAERNKKAAKQEAIEKAKEAAIKAEIEETIALHKAAAKYQEECFIEFRKAIFMANTKILNKALFAVTGNSRFQGWFYDINKDRDILAHLSVSHMMEVMEMMKC